MSETAVVKGSEYTTPEHYDPKVLQRAYKLFLDTDLSMTDIAVDLGIPMNTLVTWVEQGKWMQRKQKIVKLLEQEAEEEYKKLIRRNRGPVLERQLRASEKLEEAIEAVIDIRRKNPDAPKADMVLKRLAEALASATTISARAAAISDKPFAPDPQAIQAQGKTPLIMVNVQPQAPSRDDGRTPEPIDVVPD